MDATQLDAPPRGTRNKRASPSAPLVSDSPSQRSLHVAVQHQRRNLLAALIATADLDRLATGSLESHPASKLALQLTDCGRHPQLLQDDDTGQLIISPGRCNQRVCPTCGPIRRRQAERRVNDHLKHLDDARLLTLTLVSTDAPLAERIKDLQKAFTRFRRTTDWKSHVAGGLAVLEVTYNAKRDQWHPHLHCIIDGSYWPAKDISAKWLKTTGDSSIIDIRKVHGKRALASYISKYVTKTQTPQKAPAARISEWCLAVKGLRTLIKFGTLHNRKAESDPAPRAGSLSNIIHLGHMLDEVQHGDIRASRLYAIVKRLARDRVPADDPTRAALVLARHRRAVKRVRAWSGCPPPDADHQHPPHRTSSDQLHHTDHRPKRLWEESALAQTQD